MSNFFSALGDLRETRVTAALGYLVAKAPSSFAPMFLGGRSQIDKVLIEESEKHNRYDLVIRTPRKLVVIEAKVGFLQAPSQMRRYIRKLLRAEPDRKATLFLLDKGSDPLQTEIKDLKRQFPRCSVKQRTWSEIARVVERGCQSKKLQKELPEAVAVGRELVNHLRETQMAQAQTKEIYIRQLSGRSLELFFRHHIYKCQSKFAKNALQHIYFAPLFTAKAPSDFASRSILPIEKGLCYIARINQGKVLRRKELLQYLKKVRHPDYKKAAKMVLQQAKEKDLLVLLLGQIFRAFETPIAPGKLKVKGMLSQRTASFDELLAVSRGGI